MSLLRNIILETHSLSHPVTPEAPNNTSNIFTFHPTKHIAFLTSNGNEIHGASKGALRCLAKETIRKLVANDCFILAATDFGNVYTWEFVSLRLMSCSSVVESDEKSINILDISPHFQLYFYSKIGAKQLFLHEINKDNRSAIKVDCKKAIVAVDPHPFLPFIAVLSVDGFLKIFNYLDQTCVIQTEEFSRLAVNRSGTITGGFISWGSCGKFIALSSDAGVIACFRVSLKEKAINLFGSHVMNTLSATIAVKFHPTLPFFYTLSNCGLLRAWKDSCKPSGLASGESIVELEAVNRLVTLPIYLQKEQPDLVVTGIALHPSKNYVSFWFQRAEISTKDEPSRQVVYSLIDPNLPLKNIPLVASSLATSPNMFQQTPYLFKVPDEYYYVENGQIMSYSLQMGVKVKHYLPEQDEEHNPKYPYRMLFSPQLNAFLVFFEKRMAGSPIKDGKLHTNFIPTVEYSCAIIDGRSDIGTIISTEPGKDGFFFDQLQTTTLPQSNKLGVSAVSISSHSSSAPDGLEQQPLYVRLSNDGRSIKLSTGEVVEFNEPMERIFPCPLVGGNSIIFYSKIKKAFFFSKNAIGSLRHLPLFRKVKGSVSNHERLRKDAASQKKSPYRPYLKAISLSASTVMGTGSGTPNLVPLLTGEVVLDLQWNLDRNNYEASVGVLITNQRMVIVSSLLEELANYKHDMSAPGRIEFISCKWVGKCLFFSTNDQIKYLTLSGQVHSLFSLENVVAPVIANVLPDRLLFCSKKFDKVEFAARSIGLLEPLLLGELAMANHFGVQIPQTVINNILMNFDIRRVGKRLIDSLTKYGYADVALALVLHNSFFSSETKFNLAFTSKKFLIAYDILSHQFSRALKIGSISSELIARCNVLGDACLHFAQFRTALKCYELAENYPAIIRILVANHDREGFLQLIQKIKETKPMILAACKKLMDNKFLFSEPSSNLDSKSSENLENGDPLSSHKVKDSSSEKSSNFPLQRVLSSLTCGAGKTLDWDIPNIHPSWSTHMLSFCTSFSQGPNFASTASLIPPVGFLDSIRRWFSSLYVGYYKGNIGTFEPESLVCSFILSRLLPEIKPSRPSWSDAIKEDDRKTVKVVQPSGNKATCWPITLETSSFNSINTLINIIQTVAASYQAPANNLNLLQVPYFAPEGTRRHGFNASSDSRIVAPIKRSYATIDSSLLSPKLCAGDEENSASSVGDVTVGSESESGDTPSCKDNKGKGGDHCPPSSVSAEEEANNSSDVEDEESIKTSSSSSSSSQVLKEEVSVGDVVHKDRRMDQSVDSSQDSDDDLREDEEGEGEEGGKVPSRGFPASSSFSPSSLPIEMAVSDNGLPVFRTPPFPLLSSASTSSVFTPARRDSDPPTGIASTIKLASSRSRGDSGTNETPELRVRMTSWRTTSRGGNRPIISEPSNKAAKDLERLRFECRVPQDLLNQALSFFEAGSFPSAYSLLNYAIHLLIEINQEAKKKEIKLCVTYKIALRVIELIKIHDSDEDRSRISTLAHILASLPVKHHHRLAFIAFALQLNIATKDFSEAKRFALMLDCSNTPFDQQKVSKVINICEQNMDSAPESESQPQSVRGLRCRPSPPSRVVFCCESLELLESIGTGYLFCNFCGASFSNKLRQATDLCTACLFGALKKGDPCIVKYNR